MRNRLNQPVVAMECILDQIFAIPGRRDTGDLQLRMLAEYFQQRLSDQRDRIAIIRLIPRKQNILIGIDDHHLDRRRSAVNADMDRLLCLIKRNPGNTRLHMAVMELPVFFLILKQRRQAAVSRSLAVIPQLLNRRVQINLPIGIERSSHRDVEQRILRTSAMHMQRLVK